MINPTAHPRHPITDPGLPTFLKLSAVLTGYSEEDLERTSMLEEYFTTLMKEQDHEGVRTFLLKAEAILSQTTGIVERIKREFIDPPLTATQPDPTFDEMSYQGLAPRIILLWYTGAWTTMNDIAEKSQIDRTTVVSARAYREGLIWKTACTHPAGAKQPGFNSWSMLPLTNF